MRLAILLILLSCSAHAQWTPLSRSNNWTYELRDGSYDHSRTEKSGDPVGSIIVRGREIATGNVVFEMNYVSFRDCVAGYGKLVTTDMQGTALYSNDFITGGGNVASTIADTICAAAREAIRRQRQQPQVAPAISRKGERT